LPARGELAVRIAVLSWQKLEDLPQAMGATWLDLQLLAKAPEALGPSAMGAEVETALRARRQWLIEQGLLASCKGKCAMQGTCCGRWKRVSLLWPRIFRRARGSEVGDRLTGGYRRILTLNSGRFALIERSHDVALVPWRPVLERAHGHMATGSVGGEGISWSIGIKRILGR
jgi:hypothetical protein